MKAFHSTALDYLLRANQIEYVAFTGFHTNWCVESSARSAYDKGYRVHVISDCTATGHREEAELRGEVDLPEDREGHDIQGISRFPRIGKAPPEDGEKRRQGNEDCEKDGDGGNRAGGGLDALLLPAMAERRRPTRSRWGSCSG